jgi:predicted RNA methylase
MRVLVGELTPKAASIALAGGHADIVYSDPPWGPGNLRYWRTHNGEPDHEVNWNNFLRTFCKVVANSIKPDSHVFVEMGIRWVDQLAEFMAEHNIQELERWTCVYSAQKLPNILWHAGPEKLPVDPTGLGAVKMTNMVLASIAKPGALVFDPCCGKGMTARCAVRNGMRFAGVELNPKRAGVTQQWLDKNVH